MDSSLPTSNDTTSLLDRKGSDIFYPGHPLSSDDKSLFLPNFELLTKLGSGGMGTVFLARQQNLNRLVAVKVVKLADANDNRHSQWLQEEAQTMAALNHPNIVSIYDMVKSGDHLFIIMEYVPGRKSVRDLVLRYGPLPLPIVLRILLDVCSGLSYVQSQNFIHCDLKPDNILISNDFDTIHPSLDEMFSKPTTRVKICDFGIARHINTFGIKQNHISADGARELPLGSPNYMAPEQLLSPDDVDFRADIYSLASTAYFMLTGQAPFPFATREEVIEHKLAKDLPSLAHFPGLHCPSSLVHIIHKMGACDVQKRYDDYSKLLCDLEDVNSSLPNTLLSSSRSLQHKYFILQSVFFLTVLLVLFIIFFFVNSYVRDRFFREHYVSMSSSLGFWTKTGPGGWRIIGKKNQDSSPILLAGQAADSSLTLLPQISPGSSFEMKFRGGVSSVISRFSFDNDPSDFHAALIWQFNSTDRSNGFSFDMRGKTISIDDALSVPSSEWITCKLVFNANSIHVHLNNELVYVARCTSIPSCSFTLKVDSNSSVLFKDIYIYSTK